MFEVEMFRENGGLVTTSEASFTFEAVENPRELDNKRTEGTSLDWTNQDYQLQQYTVFPYGSTDDLPQTIRNVVQENYIAPGILKKKSQLLWGKGPKLYIEDFDEKGDLVKKWTKDAEVTKWLESWDYEKYLMKACVDFHYIECVGTMFYQDRSARLGRAPKIAKLEHRNANNHRLAKLSSDPGKDATHCIYTPDFNRHYQSSTEHVVYPLFDYNDPFKHKNAYYYSNMYSFCSDYYAVPDLYGSLEWLRRSTAVPLILKAFAKNSINVKYHVISPAKFWEKMEEELKEKCIRDKKNYEASMLLTERTKYLRKVTTALSGADNTGKFWHTVKYVEVDGNNILEHGWEIKEIPGNLKDLVTSNLEISKEANRSVAAGVGMHPALGGAGESGKSDSGSEQLYALKNYLITGIDIPEMIVCKPLNYAIKANWPEKEVKVGFYHIAPQREEDTTSTDRVKNKV
jgi:hypothetical protein